MLGTYHIKEWMQKGSSLFYSTKNPFVFTPWYISSFSSLHLKLSIHMYCLNMTVYGLYTCTVWTWLFMDYIHVLFEHDCLWTIYMYCLNMTVYGQFLWSSILNSTTTVCFRSGLCKLWSVPDCKEIRVLRGKHKLK